ncbi:hypothetical protein D3C84_658470 [compost metagenome]
MVTEGVAMAEQLAGGQLQHRPGKPQSGTEGAVEFIQMIVQFGFGRHAGDRVDIVDVTEMQNFAETLYRLEGEGAWHAVGV